MKNSLKNENLIGNNKKPTLLAVYKTISEEITESDIRESDAAMALLSEDSQRRLAQFTHPKRRYQSTQARLFLINVIKVHLLMELKNRPAIRLEERNPDSPLVHFEGDPTIWASSLAHTDIGLACGLAPLPWATLVDVEAIRADKPIAHLRKLLEAVFDSAFLEAFDRAAATLSEDRVIDRFYQYWGAYECRVKANTRACPDQPDSPRKRFLLGLAEDHPYLVDTDHNLAYLVEFKDGRPLDESDPGSAVRLGLSYVAINTSSTPSETIRAFRLSPLTLTVAGETRNVMLVKIDHVSLWGEKRMPK